MQSLLIMKKRTTLLLLFFVVALSAQDKSNNAATNDTQTFFNPRAGIGVFHNAKKAVDGTVYLFKKWDNHTVIHAIDKHSYLLKNININIQNNTIISKIGTDSIFTFNLNTIDRIVVNLKTYKPFLYENTQRICRVIYESNEFSLLKGFKIKTISGSANPMVNRPTDKLVQRSSYFIKKGEQLKPFKLSKKKILALMPVDKAQTVKRYVKKHRLSFKKDYHVQRILNYYGSL